MSGCKYFWFLVLPVFRNLFTCVCRCVFGFCCLVIIFLNLWISITNACFGNKCLALLTKEIAFICNWNQVLFTFKLKATFSLHITPRAIYQLGKNLHLGMTFIPGDTLNLKGRYCVIFKVMPYLCLLEKCTNTPNHWPKILEVRTTIVQVIYYCDLKKNRVSQYR